MKVLLISNLYPNNMQPERGIFTAQKVRRLRQYCDFKVIAPIAYFPFLQSPFAPPTEFVPAAEVIDEIEIRHPRAWYLPRIGRRFNARLFGDSIRGVVRELHKDNHFNLLWATWGYPDIVAARQIGRELGIPVIASLHGSDVNYGLNAAWSRRAMIRAFSSCYAVVTRSRVMSHLLTAVGVPEHLIQCIYNGVDTVRFQMLPRETACASAGLPVSRKRILFVGNLLPVKGLPYLIDAFATLAGSDPQVDLVIIGEGLLHGSLVRRVSQLRLQDRVKFVGRTPHAELRSYFNSSDVVCLPSLNEGLPNVILEALACGRPVVASRVGGIPEAIENDHLGLLVPPENHVLLARALESALSRTWDPNLIRAQAMKFSWDRCAQTLHSLFQQAVTGEQRPAVARSRTIAKPEERKAPSVTFISRLFPNSHDATFGRFSFQLMASLSRQSEVNVIVPIPSIPRRTNISSAAWCGQLLAYYPRFFAIPGWNRLIGGYSLRRALRGVRIAGDVILSSFLWPDGYAAAVLGRRLGIPVVAQVVGSDIDLLPRFGIRRWQTIYALRHSDHVYTVATHLAQRVRELGIPDERISVILNGVDGSLFAPGNQAQARKTLQLPSSVPIILFVGWISTDKGVEYLLRTHAALSRDCLLVLVGKDLSNGRLSRLARALGKSDRCLFAGLQPHELLPTWMNAADVFAFPSLHEGCPNVVLEALACGLPMVTTNVGGIPEITPQAPWCELVPPRDSKALGAALERLLAGQWDRKEIARASGRTWDDVGRDVSELIAKVVRR